MTATQVSYRLFAGLGDQVVAAYSDKSVRCSEPNHFLENFGLDAKRLFLVSQVHGENIVRVSADTASTNDVMADGLITDVPGISIGIRTADCVPVFFWDPEKKVIGLAHAGWKGACHLIASKMVSAFQQNFGSQVQNIKIGIGPCIRKAAYEVGAEFDQWFKGFYEPGPVEGKGHLDLPGFVKDDLIHAGILPQNIEDCGFCTYQEQNRFYSYRRENQTRERILSVISMRDGI